MKKTLILAIVCVVTLAGCGSAEKAADTASQAASGQAEETAGSVAETGSASETEAFLIMICVFLLIRLSNISV